MIKIYLIVGKDSRVLALSYRPSPNPDEIEVEVEENHGIHVNPFIYRYEDGELIKDTDYQKEMIEQRESLKGQPTTEELVKGIKEVNESQNVALAEILELQQTQLNEVKLAIAELANLTPQPAPEETDEHPESE